MVPSKAKWSLYWLARHKPYGIVLLTAVLLAASFPPLPFHFLIFIAFVPIFILFERDVVPIKVPEDKVFRPFKSLATVSWRLITLQFIWRRPTRGLKVFSYRRKFISGNAQLYRYTYIIFLIWNGCCCYWLVMTALGASTVVEALVNATAGILAVALNPALMSIPFQLFSRIRHVLTPTWSAASLVVFWLAFEYLHFNWDLSWSWLTLGHALSPWPAMIQYAEWTGVLGVSMHILVANVLIYSAYRNIYHKRQRVPRFAISAGLWLALPLILYPILTNSNRPILQPTGELTVRIVQPNIDPYLKYNYFTPEEQIQHFRELILADSLDGVDLVVLPETAIPRRFNLIGLRQNRIMRPLWDIADTLGVPVLTGFEEYRMFLTEKEAPLSARQTVQGTWMNSYNSATVLRPGKMPESYQKSKLVPMVERMPFLELLHDLKEYNMDLGTGMGGYGLPDSLKNLEVAPGVEVGMMICYESEFSDLVRKSSLRGADFLAIITNDGWWGNTSGYIQHAHFAALRAIENRRWVVRSANTGRSLFADPFGNFYDETSWWEPTTVDRTIELHEGTTFYARNGDFLGHLALWLTCFISLATAAWYYLGKFTKNR